MSVIFLPVYPFQSPEITLLEKALIFLSAFLISGFNSLLFDILKLSLLGSTFCEISFLVLIFKEGFKFFLIFLNHSKKRAHQLYAWYCLLIQILGIELFFL